MTLPGLPQSDTTKVACGSCHRCCKGFQAVILTEGEDPRNFDAREVGPGIWLLNHKPNGDCAHLGDSGCAIWGRHPRVCKTFDCAGFVRRMDEGAFVALGAQSLSASNAVIKEGRKRLLKQGRAA